MRFARVFIDVPRLGPFDYLVNGINVEIGALVIVPFGRRRVVGVVAELTNKSELIEKKIKSIEALLPLEPLKKDFLKLAEFASVYYHKSMGETIFTALPSMVRSPKFSGINKEVSFSLTRSGIERIPGTLTPRAIGKHRLWKAMLSKEPVTLKIARGIYAPAGKLIREWQDRGWVESELSSKPKSINLPRSLEGLPSSAVPALNSEQQGAVNEISKSLGSFKTWLLQGITGSGKTEVYFSLIEEVISRGQQALILVPEINLTPQLESRLNKRFPSKQMVMLHSALSGNERYSSWNLARAGTADIILGTRLAIFTPIPRLGIVIVDEEQDTSFKQMEGLRYNARDLAVVVGKQRGIPVVLGSATPSLESYAQVLEGRYDRLMLRTRASGTTPEISLLRIDKKNRIGLLPEAVNEIRQALLRREQVLVFINRRGFAPVLYCSSCGWKATCKRCTTNLTMHSGIKKLRCHHCGYQQDIPNICAECGDQDIVDLGQGTQRIEQIILTEFPTAQVIRIDGDTTKRKGSFSRMRENIEKQGVDIIVGTQMLSKGHDFANLTLVIVLGADASLFGGDYRSTEYLYQQVLQVSGRSGRSARPGKVLVQTEFPEHPIYRSLVAQDFDGFAAQLLSERKKAGFPPFGYHAILRVASKDEKQLWRFLTKSRDLITTSDKSKIEVYDAVPSAVYKVAGMFRGQILLQSKNRKVLQRFLSAWLPMLENMRDGKVRFSLDIDPVEL